MPKADTKKKSQRRQILMILIVSIIIVILSYKGLFFSINNIEDFLIVVALLSLLTGTCVVSGRR